MGAGTNFILGGLLQGAGAGLIVQAQQRREDALISLRRQYQKEDEIATEQRTIGAEQRANEREIETDKRRGADLEGRTAILGYASDLKQRENESDFEYAKRLEEYRSERRIIERGVDADYDAAAADRAARIAKDLKQMEFDNERETAEVERALAANEIDSSFVTDNGFRAIQYKNGVIKISRTRVRDSNSDDSGGGATIGAEASQRGVGGASQRPARTTPAPAPAVAPERTPTGIRQIQAGVDALLTSNQMERGEGTGQTATIPAGMVAAVPITVRWNGQRWVYEATN